MLASLLIAGKESCLDVNAEKSKYVFMSREERVGKTSQEKDRK
jgi:hypothetical protein